MLVLAKSAVASKNIDLDPKSVTVSGVSSGAFMAVQMHVIHSKVISGAASVAGGAFACARSGSLAAQLDCMSRPSSDRADEFIASARELEGAGSIDLLTHLHDDRVLIFSSQNDSVVSPKNADRLESFYRAFIPSTQILRRQDEKAAHGFPTLNYGSPCEKGKLPWLLQCQLDLAGDILNFFYGPLESRKDSKKENLRRFSQTSFGSERALLYESGWIYIPTDCQRGATCRLHLAFHGCQMNPDFIQDQFVVHSGFNEWAEGNRIIILYPQAAKSSKSPQACWDWFGATGPDYLTKSGLQIQAVFQMIQALFESRFELSF